MSDKTLVLKSAPKWVAWIPNGEWKTKRPGIVESHAVVIIARFLRNEAVEPQGLLCTTVETRYNEHANNELNRYKLSINEHTYGSPHVKIVLCAMQCV